jgi:hypothetical protein
MRRTVLIFVISLLVGISGTASNKSKPTLSQTPLTSEDLELYGIFLDSFVGKGKELVNFSEKTLPLTLADSDNEGPCLEGIRLKRSAEAAQTIHMFPTSIADGRAIHLVDPSKHKTLLATRSQLGFEQDCSVFLKLLSMRLITSQPSNSALSVAHYVGVVEL